MYYRAAQRAGVWVAAALLLTGLTACSSGAPAPSPASTPPLTPAATVPAVPAGGVSLRQLGFTQGPVDFLTVPAAARVDLRVDQPNNVTAGFGAPEGPEIAAWLRTHLGAGGFRITADSPSAVLFTGHGWDGAFTLGGGQSALTLRRTAR